jgi:hypothetical protein
MVTTAALIPHRPATAGPGDPLVFATAADGSPAGFAIGGESPHLILAGAAGSGLTVTCRVLSLEAARRGMDVRACCDTESDARGLGSWPNITAASSARETIALVGTTFGDMMTRFADIETGGRLPAGSPRIVLVVDEYITWSLLAADSWAMRCSGSDRGECPAFGQLAALLALGRPAGISVVLAARGLRPRSIPAALLDTIGTRVTLSKISEETAWTLFGGAADDLTDIPPGVRNAAIWTPDGRSAATMHWLPDPAGRLDAGERRLLHDMLPPGSSWHGPRRAP